MSEKSPLRGITLVDSGIRQETDVIIVAIRTKDGEMKFNPSSMTRIEAGDTLISLGKSEDLTNWQKSFQWVRGTPAQSEDPDPEGPALI